MPKAKEVSAGGVVYRTLRGETVLALCRRWGGSVWCLPKGLIDPGESTEEAALREVREETGVRARILDRLGEIHYRFSRTDAKGRRVDVSKRVTFFLMRRTAGNISLHDREVEEVRWFPVREALRKATFPTERAILRKAAARL